MVPTKYIQLGAKLVKKWHTLQHKMPFFSKIGDIEQDYLSYGEDYFESKFQVVINNYSMA